MNLAGKVSIITGGGSGIGRATALALAHKGSKVCIVGRTQGKLNDTLAKIELNKGKGITIEADITKYSSIEKAVNLVVKKWGTIDILVNNAGANIKNRGILETTPDEMQSLVDINLLGTMFFTKAVLPTMVSQNLGTIINVSSNSAIWPSLMGGVAYSAAKAGVNNFTEFLNDELQHTLVRACSISPGEVVTPILENRPVKPDKKGMSKMCQPEDIADAILLVTSQPSRTMITDMVVTPTLTRDTSLELIKRPGQ
ncbi:MAG: 3-oxoacyl-ACP reductase [Dehalococcoidia bacterium]|nr:3-oxoacyl-ACP reductase [Dehalococcoidia bacterium]|tara:strand:+ start:4077 stop:4841 length:765 start_codon:yes stop_codon:yes gene_type:complete